MLLLFKNSLVLLLVGLILSSCKQFIPKNTEKEIRHFGFEVVGEFSKTSLCDSTVVVLFYKSSEDGYPYDFILLEGLQNFSYRNAFFPEYINIFCDKNKDFVHQDLESSDHIDIIRPADKNIVSVNITINFNKIGGQNTPDNLKNISILELAHKNKKFINIGSVEKLSKNNFSLKNSRLGLWKPMQFVAKRLPGLYFSEPFDPAKDIVLFVHGISGSPSEFQYISSQLDSGKYQVWFYYYPSGLRLEANSRELFKLLAIAKKEFDFSKIHIVAHSMGGLVVRNLINFCYSIDICNDLKSFISISTPWAGHDAAKIGLEFSPSVVPVWRDLVPNSQFLQGLFIKPLPQHVRHYLMFSIKQKDMLVFQTNDGVVSMASMLDERAQKQAYKLVAFNEDHASILQNERLIQELQKIFLYESRY